MEILGFSNSGIKIFVYLCLFICTVKEIHGLTCYQCSWSDSAADYDEYMKDKNQKELKYPIVKPFIGGQLDHPPSSKVELDAYCAKEPCKHESQVCLVYSFISDTPKNVTYMCVGNPNRKKGCFKQEIPGEDVKQYLKVEACLCNDKDLCNRGRALNNNGAILFLLQTVLVTVSVLVLL